ncbi:conserved exported hypothetical protein [Mesorhizobium plurifarium]|uniref:Lipoprotein n=1 Tax=Mesorhizobium plurifarium TaxID=69974 RepID=A0A0K2VXZ2_MESPL|nr:conserved exported hypothetical protein [Mesorhizobium plurifarium]
MGKGLIVAAMAAALAGCTTAKGGFCAVALPMRLSDKAVDALTDQEARALLAHNRKGEKLCGWRP